MTRKEIDSFPNGEWSGEAIIDDDSQGNGPFTVRVNVKIKGSDLFVDYRNSDEKAKGTINCPYASTLAATYTAIRQVVNTRVYVPANDGSTRPIIVDAPLGSIVNPTPPASVHARFITAYRCYEAVMDALSKAVPNRTTAVGFNSTFFSYKYINKKALIIQVDIEPSSLGRYFPITIGICTDSKTFVKQLYDRLSKIKNLKKTNIWTKNFLEEKKIYLKKREEEANFINPIQPSALFKILRETLPSNSVITLDAGTLCLQATDQLNYSGPKSLFTPLDFGLVGFSFACGLGVKLANPNSKVISLMGDGGFGMTISELSTAVEYKINTITIVLNNKSWGAEKAYQRDYYDQRYIGSEITSPPFHKIVELYGGIGFHVKKINELKNVIRKALKCSKPVVINVEVDPNAIYSFRKDSFKHKEQ